MVGVQVRDHDAVEVVEGHAEGARVGLQCMTLDHRKDRQPLHLAEFGLE